MIIIVTCDDILPTPHLHLSDMIQLLSGIHITPNDESFLFLAGNSLLFLALLTIPNQQTSQEAWAQPAQ